MAQAEIGGRERVAFTARSHGDVVRRPGADAGELEQTIDERRGVGSRFERDRAGRDAFR